MRKHLSSKSAAPADHAVVATRVKRSIGRGVRTLTMTVPFHRDRTGTMKGARHDIALRTSVLTVAKVNEVPTPRSLLLSQDGIDRLAQQAARILRDDVNDDVIQYLKHIFTTISTGTYVLSTEGDGALPVAPSDADPLAAARARGRLTALREYAAPENLTLLLARDYAARNERTINEERQAGKLYALLPPGKSRGFRYPKWQFDADPARLSAALHPFIEANANAWMIHAFAQRRYDELDGRCPAECIVDECVNIDRIVQLARRDLADEQGAL